MSFSGGALPGATRKSGYFEPARHSFRNQSAKVLFSRAFVKQAITNECDYVVKLVAGEPDWVRQQRIDSAQYWFYWPKPERQIVINAGSPRIVSSGRQKNVEMVSDSILQAAECAVMEKGRLERGVPQR